MVDVLIANPMFPNTSESTMDRPEMLPIISLLGIRK